MLRDIIKIIYIISQGTDWVSVTRTIFEMHEVLIVYYNLLNTFFALKDIQSLSLL